MRIRPGVEFASLSDVGCRRENNEDSYGYWEPDDGALFASAGRLAVIADGMGGHEGGQIASRMAIEIVVKSYADSREADPQQRLKNAFAEAHRRIQQQSQSDSNLNGMGTTCTAFALVGDQLHFCHVGDSRLYILTEGQVRVLTRDHTLVAHWVESGVLRAGDLVDRQHAIYEWHRQCLCGSPVDCRLDHSLHV